MKQCTLLLVLPLLGALNCRRHAPTEPPSATAPPALHLTVSCPEAPAVSDHRGQLAMRQTTHGQLAAGHNDSYELRLGAGEYLRVLADQSQLDLVLCFYGPDRTLRLALDSPNGQDEPEELLWWSREPGIYTLSVSSQTTAPTPRPYLLTAATLPTPSARDQARIAAVVAAADADELRRSSSASSWPLARRQYLVALSRWEAVGDRFRQADVLARLGRLDRDRLGEPRRALESYERSRILFTELGARRSAALVVASLGKTSLTLGRLDQAIEYQRQALTLFAALQDRREQAVALSEIANLDDLRGDGQAALDSYSRALQLWSSIADPAGLATALHDRGLLYSSLGEYREALDDFERARRLRTGSPRNLGATLSAMGNTHTLAGRPAAALPLLHAALVLRRAAADRRGEAVTESALGIALRQLGRRAEAVEWHRRALSTFQRIGNPRDQARALHNLGTSLREAGRLREAGDVLDLAVESARRTDDEETVAKSLLPLAETRIDQGDPMAALPLMRQALQGVETQRVRSSSPELRSAFLATKQDLYESAVELLMDLDRRFPGRGFRIEALDVSERSRARSLLDELRDSGVEVRAGVAPDLIAQRRHLEGAIRLTDGLLRRLNSETPVPDSQALARRLRSLLRDYDRLTVRIHDQAPGFRSLTGAEPLTTRSVQARVLDATTLLLHYKLGKKRSFLWAVAPTSVAVFTLPPREILDPLARRAHRLLAGPDDAPSRAQTQLILRRLSDAVLAPAAKLLGAKRLLIIADGALQLVPFAALPSPRAESGQRPVPLMVEHELVTMPSASALAILKSQQQGRRPGPKPLALIADPVFSPDDPRVRALLPRPAAVPVDGETSPYSRLPHSRIEAEAITALAPHQDVLIALDFAASRKLVLSGVLGQYRIVHFATHVEIDPEHSELSRLVLSQVDEQGRPEDGLLYAHEVFDLQLPADLVVLSGCETGLGKEVRGEGLVGLPQAFLYAGAARLVVSLWKVGDRATAILFQAFYRHLLQSHESPSQALRNAQIELWREDPGSYRWAAFISLGRWR